MFVLRIEMCTQLWYNIYIIHTYVLIVSGDSNEQQNKGIRYNLYVCVNCKNACETDKKEGK